MVSKIFSNRITGFGASWLYLLLLSAQQVRAAGDGEVHLMDPSKDMVLWTWVTFGLLLIVLYRFAWNPILSALDKREKEIKDSVENAAKIKEELEKVEGSREQLIKEADDKAKEIVATARKAAVEASRVIEEKAKEEAKILLENANREIKASREKAIASLRQDSATLATEIAEKLIGANLDSEKNKELTERLIGKI